MPAISDSQRNEPLIESLLSAFNAFLKNPDEKSWAHDVLLQCLERYATSREVFNRDFYTITLDSHPDVNALAEQILKTLKVGTLQKNRFVGMRLTLYEFLVELNELTDNKNAQLSEFIELIDKHNHTQWKFIVLGTFIGSGIGLLPFFLYGLSAIQQFFTIASIIPAGGLAYAVGMGFYTLYEYNTSRNVSYYQLFRDNFFSLTNAVLSIVAWSLLFTAAATTPIVSVLFVLADFVFVIKEAISLSYFYYQDKERVKSEPNLDKQYLEIREQINFEKRKNAAWVHFLAAVVLTVIIAAWCFVPGGIFVAAACMLAMGIVYAIKQYAIHQNEEKMKGLLVKEFSVVELAEQHKNELILQDGLMLQASINPQSNVKIPGRANGMLKPHEPKQPNVPISRYPGMFSKKIEPEKIEPRIDTESLNKKVL